MATLDDLVVQVGNISTAVTALAPAINSLEAKVTAALASAGISAADQAKIDTAFAALKTAGDQINAAVADANDGVDEAANPAPADTTTQPPADPANGPT